MVVVVECVQKWEAGSRLWNYLEMDISQDNGRDSLGLSSWTVAPAGTSVRTHAQHVTLAKVTSPLCLSLLICGRGNSPTSQGLVSAQGENTS